MPEYPTLGEYRKSNISTPGNIPDQGYFVRTWNSENFFPKKDTRDVPSGLVTILGAPEKIILYQGKERIVHVYEGTIITYSPISDEDELVGLLNKLIGHIPKFYSMNVSEFGFCARVINCLSQHGINTIGQLAGLTQKELQAWPGFGATSLREVRKKLSHHGLSLKKDEE